MVDLSGTAKNNTEKTNPPKFGLRIYIPVKKNNPKCDIAKLKKKDAGKREQ